MNLYTEMGGGEVALMHLLKELDQEKFDPVMLFNGEGTFVNKVRELGVSTEILPYETVMLRELLHPTRLLQARRGARALSRYLELNRPDLVHCGDVLSLLLLLPALRRGKIPVVYSVIFEYEWTRLLAFNLLAMLTVDRIVANSDSIRRDIERRTAIPNATVETVVPGVDGSVFFPRKVGERSPLKQELGLAHDVKLVGMAARFDPAKGHMVFLDAARELVRRHEKIRFVIAGGSMMDKVIPSLQGYEERVKAYCHEAGLDAHVTFLGHREDMGEFFRSLDLYVCPSLSEGFGLTVAEAFACDLPVVASRAVAAVELFADHPYLVLAEPGEGRSFAAAIDRLFWLLRSGAKLPGPSTKLQLHSWRDYARRFEHLYEEVVGRN